MHAWWDGVRSVHLLTVLIAGVMIYSIVQGYRRGAFGSARAFAFFWLEAGLTLAALAASWKWAEWLSPHVRDGLISLDIRFPEKEIGPVGQIYYTFVTGLRDFSLMRFGILFALGYPVFKNALGWGVRLLATRRRQGGHSPDFRHSGSGERAVLSGVAGSVVGALFGVVPFDADRRGAARLCHAVAAGAARRVYPGIGRVP